jgi:hypothetical protein
MGCLVYGTWAAAEAFATAALVYRLLELPAGLKRVGPPEGAIRPARDAHRGTVDKPG